jgi:hypothetical protein
MGYVGPARSASFRADVNNVVTRFDLCLLPPVTGLLGLGLHMCINYMGTQRFRIDELCQNVQDLTQQVQELRQQLAKDRLF